MVKVRLSLLLEDDLFHRHRFLGDCGGLCIRCTRLIIVRLIVLLVHVFCQLCQLREPRLKGGKGCTLGLLLLLLILMLLLVRVIVAGELGGGLGDC